MSDGKIRGWYDREMDIGPKGRLMKKRRLFWPVAERRMHKLGKLTHDTELPQS